MAKVNITPPTLSDNNIRNFWKHVDKETPHGPWGNCWRWTATTNNKGYGTFGVRHDGINRYLTPHRVSYFIATGIWTEKLVRHTCDTYDCCNPDHLIDGTNKDNTQDALERNRLRKGETIPWAKLTEADVRLIRSLAGTMKEKEIIEIIGKPVSTGCIHDVIIRRSWKHI